MSELAARVEFWVAMAFAVVVKLRASPSLTRSSAILTVIAAVMGALVFTEPVHEWLGFGGESAKFAAAALVALTCEHIARMLLTLTIQDVIGLWGARK